MVTAPVETFQAEWELDQLVSIFHDLRPARVLEVGAMHGGTLWHWLCAEATETVTVIDDEMRNAGAWQEWARSSGISLHLLKGPSQAKDIVTAARNLGPYDFIFIDADHTYDAVKDDWAHFAPLVAPGGVIAFHDILPRIGYGVSDVWAEIKFTLGARTMEICQNEVMPGAEGRCGIGILWT
jgi:predicted O-methyltransferase YrrM